MTNLIQPVSRFTMALRTVACLTLLPFGVMAETSNDYSDVHAIFQKHCLDCHESSEPDGNLILDSYEALMKGGESGASIVPGKSAESLLALMVEGKFEKDGKKKIMPPGAKRKKLEASEIATIKSWIDAGAKPPTQAISKTLVVPKVAVKGEARQSVLALSHSPIGKVIAVARSSTVDLISTESRTVLHKLPGHSGNVNAVTFSPDGTRVYSVSGENALFGEIRQWNAADGSLIRSIQSHRDTIYSIAVSPDGKTLATGSYDQDIKLWDAETGKEIRTLHGHNGAVFGLAFRPDGKILASASADRTVKLWNAAKGERTDTLSQPSKEVYCVAFSSDGKKLYAGGADNRIRVWQVSPAALETTNPILESKFAHEGSILRLAFSPNGKMLLSSADDRTVKLWDAASLREQLLLEKQKDWATGICFGAGKTIVIGRMDGSFGFYDFNGKLLSAGPSDSPKSHAQANASRN